MPPATPNISPYLNMGVETAKGIINNFAADMRARAQRKWSEKMIDKQNDWSLEMWNKTNEYNDPANQVARLDAAGLNPLYYGLDGSSANALESATPLGYSRASDTVGLANPIPAFQEAAIRNSQKLNIDADTENKEQNTRLQAEQAAGAHLDNWFKNRTMEARVAGEYLKNDLTKGQIKQLEKAVDQIEQNIKESIARTKTEEERQLLTKAQTWLANAQAKEIAALLPHRQLLLDAQTEAQKAAAAVDFTHNLYEAGLIDEGYIEAMVSKMRAEAKTEDQEAAIKAWELAVRNGHIYDEAETGVGRFLNWGANALISNLSVLGEALGPMSGIVGAFVGGKGIGAGMSSVGTKTVQSVPKNPTPQFRPKYPTN